MGLKNHWNFRVLAFETKHPLTQEIHIEFRICEVHYEGGKPRAYGEGTHRMNAESVTGLKWRLNKMRVALRKPILCTGDKWPQEYDGPTEIE